MEATYLYAALISSFAIVLLYAFGAAPNLRNRCVSQPNYRFVFGRRRVFVARFDLIHRHRDCRVCVEHRVEGKVQRVVSGGLFVAVSIFLVMAI